MSKYPNLKDKKKLKEILIKDIMKDATKDDFKVP